MFLHFLRPHGGRICAFRTRITVCVRETYSSTFLDAGTQGAPLSSVGETLQKTVMEFTDLWRLPYHVAREIVVLWLSLSALVKFDTAVCSTRLRANFLSLVRGHNAQRHIRRRVLTEPMLEWFGNRKLKLDKLELYSRGDTASLRPPAVNVLASVTTMSSSVANQAEEILICNYVSCMQSLTDLSLTPGLCDAVLSQKLCGTIGSPVRRTPEVVDLCEPCTIQCTL
jgi:hypothetical protein